MVVKKKKILEYHMTKGKEQKAKLHGYRHSV